MSDIIKEVRDISEEYGLVHQWLDPSGAAIYSFEGTKGFVKSQPSVAKAVKVLGALLNHFKDAGIECGGSLTFSQSVQVTVDFGHAEILQDGAMKDAAVSYLKNGLTRHNRIKVTGETQKIVLAVMPLLASIPDRPKFVLKADEALKVLKGEPIPA